MAQDWPSFDLDDPAVVASVLARQPLVRGLFAARPNAATVPFFDSREVSYHQVVAALDQPAYQLLFLVRHHRQLSRAMALAEAVDLEPALLDRAARDLVVSGLATLNGPWLVLRGRLAVLFPTPQPLFADGAAYISSQELARACRLLGLTPVPARKADRIEAIAAVLGDDDALADALDTVSDTARHVYSLVLRRTAEHASERGVRAGVQHTEEFLPPELRMTDAYRDGGAGAPVLPLDELCDRLLLGAKLSRREVWLWAESVVALAGSMFDRWPAPPVPDLVSLDAGSTGRVADVLHAIDEVTRAASAAAPVGNKTGGRRPPVKHWRSVARAAGLDPDLMVMAGGLAIELGLLVPELGVRKGSGRTLSPDCTWYPEPDRIAAFARLTPARRWALAVRAWLMPEVQPDAAGEESRRLLLELLRSLPEGLGVPTAALGAWAAATHIGLDGEVVDDVMAGSVRLGLVSEGSAVGLSSAGRTLFDDRDRLGSLLDAGTTGVTVQADHTVIAPGGSSVDIGIGLRRIAEIESTGAATVWRLSARKLAEAAASADDFRPLAFLEHASRHDLPPGVRRLVADATASAEAAVLRPAGCLLTGDPAVIAEVVGHRTTQLEIVAPGVAVSPLSEAEVGEILRSEGFLLGRGAWADAGSASPAPAPPSTWEVPHRSPTDPWPDDDRSGVGPVDVVELARRSVEGRR